MRRPFTHISTYAYGQVLIFTAAWTGALWRKRKWPNFKPAAKGIRTRAGHKLTIIGKRLKVEC